MRAGIGVLVPGGNPTVEPELYRMAPAGVTIHFARLDSNAGTPGSADVAEAEAVMISGTGLPTAGIVERLERDLGTPPTLSALARRTHDPESASFELEARTVC